MGNISISRREPSQAIVRTFSDIEPERINWLWENRIALGKFTLFAGDPGEGKSLATLDIAGRISLGRPFPEGSPCIVGDTIILTGEDDPSDTIRPRLDILGADVNRVHIIEGERLPDGTIKPMTLKKITAFIDAIKQIKDKGHNLSLVIIDPVDSFLVGANSNKNEEVRAALDGLCALAADEKFAIIGIKHLNKNQKGNAAYRVGGSIAFTAKSRAAWIFAQDKLTGRNLFLPLKNNLGPKGGGGFQYSIQEKEINGIKAAFLNWEHPVDDDIRDILKSNSPRHEVKAQAQDEIVELLLEAGGIMKTSVIAEKIGKTIQSTHNALKKLEDKFKVFFSKYGYWEVVQKGPDSMPQPKFTRCLTIPTL